MRNYLNNIVSFIGRNPTTPALITPNAERNQRTIEALIEAGSDPDKPHQLEHHFYCYSRELMNGLTSKGSALGYTVANVGHNKYEGARCWYADLIKHTKLDLEVINAENSRLLSLASEFEGSYDGWGSKLVL